MDAQRLVIGLCGPEGAGKTTVARIIEDKFGAVIVPFAKPLKSMISALGVPDVHLYGTPAQKEQPLAMLGGKSARHAMQYLGTEWARDCIDPNLWVNAWDTAVRHAPTPIVVSDDLRFENEAEAIKKLGGMIIRVVRDPDDANRREGAGSLHRSQEFWKINPDCVIVNSRGLAELSINVQFVVANRFLVQERSPADKVA